MAASSNPVQLGYLGSALADSRQVMTAVIAHHRAAARRPARRVASSARRVSLTSCVRTPLGRRDWR